MSYNDVFGGNLIQVADPSYLAINLNQNITLSWPSQFQDTNQVVADIMDVTPDQGGRTITLPDSTQVSVGADFLIVNMGNPSFGLLKNDGSPLATLTNGEAAYFYLTSNTDAIGTWHIIPFGQGFASVTSVGLQVPDVADAANLVVDQQDNPVTGAGTLKIGLGGDLQALTKFGDNPGIAVHTAAQTWALRSLSGDDNIEIANGSGVSNAEIVVSLNQDLTLLNSIAVGNMRLGTSTITTTQTTSDLILDTAGTREIIANKNIKINAGSILKLMNDADHYVSLSSNTGRTSNLNLKWFQNNPADGQLLQYQRVDDTNGILGWATVPTIPEATVENGIAKFSNDTGSLVSSEVKIDANDNISSSATIAANSFVMGNIKLLNANNIITTAGSLVVKPNNVLNINSNVYIGESGFNDNRRTLYFYYNDYTLGLAPPALTTNIKFILPNNMPTANNSLLKCDITDANVGTLSFIDLNPSLIKAWGIFNAAVNPITSPAASNANIARVGALGSGHYRVTITLLPAFGTPNYAIALSYSGTGVVILRYLINSTTEFDIFAVDATNASVDPTTISFQVIGI